jgi:hypothetical protein
MRSGGPVLSLLPLGRRPGHSNRTSGAAGKGKAHGATSTGSLDTPPRLHRHAHHDQEADHAQPAHGDGTPIPVIYANEVERQLLLDFFGVNDLAAIEGTEERTVHLSPESDLGCPSHLLTLKPDACRSCRFLAGET